MKESGERIRSQIARSRKSGRGPRRRFSNSPRQILPVNRHLLPHAQTAAAPFLTDLAGCCSNFYVFS